MSTTGNGYHWIESVSESSLTSQFQALMKEVREALSRVGTISADPGRIPLAGTLMEFARFSRDFFNFFTNHSDPLFVRRAALEKIQREWLSLHRLVAQRRSEHFLPDLKAADAIADDCLQMGVAPSEHYAQAQEYIQMGIPLDDTPSRACLTLFEETHLIHIARYAYYRAPTFGIPLAVRHAPWHWIGVGHEIGHYHYWNHSPVFEGNLEIALLEGLSEQVFGGVGEKHSYTAGVHQLELWHDWLEEIVADIFGVLILGPAYIRSLIGWLRPRVTPDTLLDNDRDHPPALLRPLLQIHALRAFHHMLNSPAGELDEEADQLEQEWKDCWTDPAAGGKPWEEWLMVPIEHSSTRDCLDLVPIVANVVIESIANTIANPSGAPWEAISANYYTADTHKRVRAFSQLFGDMEIPDKDHPVRLALTLPVAWYAWTHALTVEDEGERKTQLERIQTWVKLRASFAADYSPGATTTAQAALEAALSADEWPPEPTPSESFLNLINLRPPDISDEAFAAHLLATEFSTQEEKTGRAYYKHTHSSSTVHTHYHPA